jgi:hypothetical protein
MIYKLKKAARRPSSSWHKFYVWIRIIRIEQRDGSKPIWGIVLFDTIERRYSATYGRNLWRMPK